MLPSRVISLLALLGLLVTATLQVAAGPATAQPATPLGSWPLRPRPQVVRGFDPPDLPFGSGHRGVDLLGLPGQVVRSALAGTVTFAGLLAGRGVVVVDHGDTRTTYEPVEATVAVGDLVDQGAAIGRLAAVSSHCPPRACLHWGWLRGDTYLDPLLLVGAGPVRLLPLWQPLDTDSSSAWPVVTAARSMTNRWWGWWGWWGLRLGDAPAGRPGADGPW